VIVTVNGVRREVEEGLSVAALVDDLAGGTRGTAVAVNQEVVPRSTWASTRLQPGDAVELLRAAQGG
jgi:sulfur carrier protein